MNTIEKKYFSYAAIYKNKIVNHKNTCTSTIFMKAQWILWIIDQLTWWWAEAGFCTWGCDCEVWDWTLKIKQKKSKSVVQSSKACICSLIWLLTMQHCFEGRKTTQWEKNCTVPTCREIINYFISTPLKQMNLFMCTQTWRKKKHQYCLKCLSPKIFYFLIWNYTLLK